jgi:hypothetical protein
MGALGRLLLQHLDARLGTVFRIELVEHDLADVNAGVVVEQVDRKSVV